MTLNLFDTYGMENGITLLDADIKTVKLHAVVKNFNGNIVLWKANQCFLETSIRTMTIHWLFENFTSEEGYSYDIEIFFFSNMKQLSLSIFKFLYKISFWEMLNSFHLYDFMIFLELWSFQYFPLYFKAAYFDHFKHINYTDWRSSHTYIALREGEGAVIYNIKSKLAPLEYLDLIISLLNIIIFYFNTLLSKSKMSPILFSKKKRTQRPLHIMKINRNHGGCWSSSFLK